MAWRGYPILKLSVRPMGLWGGKPAGLERDAAISHFGQPSPISPPISTVLHQVLVQIIFQSHPQPPKDLLQLGVQRVQLLQNVILTLFQLV